MLRISPPGPAPKSPPDEPPLLSLTHFSRAPFVSFGCVRPGSVSSACLLLHNPNPEPASLAVFKLPKNRGFSIVETETVIPPLETISLTITWTPLEEGNVREIVTFIVNDVVKHQAVLLGCAELPVKKKRNTWSTIRMKNKPIGPKIPVRRQKEVEVTSKTRKLNVTKKDKHGQLESTRSPLQSCENLARSLCTPSPMREIRLSTENRVPALTISPVGNELEPFAPGSLKRSKTYSVLCTVEYNESTEVTTTSKYYTDVHVEEEWTLNAHKLNKQSMSPINPMHSQNHNVTLTPDLMIESALNSIISPTAFCNQGPVQIDACTSVHTEEELTQERFNLASSKMPSPASPMVTPKRKFLSPNSFLNNSFVPDEFFSADEHTPIISPEQFVRENGLTSQSASSLNGPMLSNSCQLANQNLSTLSSSSAIQDVQISGGPVEQELSSPIMEPVLNSRLTYCVKKTKQLIKFAAEHDQNLVEEPEKPCVLSATVTKLKAEDRKEKPTGQLPKSRRRLDNTTPEHKGSVTSSNIVLQDLPVISVPCLNYHSSAESYKRASKSLVLNRKRKSEEFLGTNKETELGTIPQFKKTHLSKPDFSNASNKEKFSQRKPLVTQLRISEKNLKTQNAAAKGKPTILKAQSDYVGPPKQKVAVTFKNSKRVVAIPQSKLVFTKTPKTVIPRHPMPFAAKNMFYDERWMAKQERGFTWWLNFILTPDDFAVTRDSSKVHAATLILGTENTHKVSVPRAPTKEEVSLKAYTTRCKLNRLRRSACRLFTSEPVVKAILRLEVEIEAQRLLVRRDRHLWKDIGERQKILNWLLSYNPLWLRIGLETIFGELISLESNSDVTGLAVFILNRLLWNPDIAAEYRHPSVPHLYRDGHEEALSKFTLKKLLLLVFFLDHAKQSRLIDHDPCLFWKDAEYKTSKDLLLSFSRDFLSGEGDLSRHLGYLGLPVSHVQTPLDEFDFAVTNLAVDLQCGVRLVRTVELLAQNWSLSKKLRVPAISRLQKMHNVEVALQALMERGVPLKDERGASITSKDIVDRHRERTLALLWKIVFAFQVDVLLSTKQLKEEIQVLKVSYSTQKQLAALRSLSNPMTIQKRESDPFEPEKYSERVSLLMEWVNAVCRFYSTKVQNFTVSFSDGRVFCYLVNHYHPSYLPLNAVSQRTTQTVECCQSGTAMLNSSSDSDNSLDVWPGVFDQGVTSSALYKELLENEQTNFSLVHTAVADLGGIPAMVHHSDMSNTIPDEKIVITFLSFLCARLLDLRKETRAARVIQTFWRNYRLKVEQKLLESKHKAACVIQRAVIRFLSRCRLQIRSCSAVVIQKNFRRYLAQRQLKELKALKHKELQTKATVIIQRFWRGYSAQRRFIFLRHYVIRMQARVRAKRAESSYKRIQWATLTLQSHMHSWLLGKKERQKYLHMKSSIIIIQHAFKKWKSEKQKRHTEAVLIIQKCYRRWKACKLIAQNIAAVKIQSVYRMHRERQKFLDTKCKIIRIQSWFRCKRDRKAFLIQRKNVLTLQQYYRAFKQGRLDRKTFLEMRSAAVCIQAHYRGMRVRQLYHRIKAACILQSYWRMRQQKKMYTHMKQLVVLLQSNVRKYQQEKQFKGIKSAACVIQSYYRSHRATKLAVHRFKQKRNAATVIQSAFRRMQARKANLQVKSAVKIQALYRSYVTRRKFVEMKAASIKIQSAFRMRQRRVRYCALRKATLFVQQKFRAKKQMQKQQDTYIKLQMACVKVQAAVRGNFVRKEIQSWHKAATVLQAQYRMWRQKKQYLLIYRAAIIIQEHYRAHKMQVHQRANFLLIKHSAIILQAAYRGYTLRKSIMIQRFAAIRIQTAFRSCRIRGNYLRIKQSVVTIQRWYRCKTAGRKERERFLCSQRAIVTIQSAYRGWVTRKQVKVWNTAAVCVQSAFRRYAAQKKIRTMTKAALNIQQRYRAVLASRRERKRYLELCIGVKKIQALWRGRTVRKDLERQHKSAALIQSYYRMHVCQIKYRAMKQASLLIQRLYRAHKLGQSQRYLYLSLKKSATVLQSAYRGWKVRRQMQNLHNAATTIQAAFRSFICQKRYNVLTTATITIQRHYRAFSRGRLQRTKYINVRKSVIVLQSAFRSALVRKSILRMHQSAVVVQRNYRALLTGRKVRKQYLELHKATCSLQAAWRGRTVRKDIERQHKSAALIQSYYRMHVCQIKYRAMKQASLLIQQFYRAHKLGQSQRYLYLSLKKSATVLQSAYRGWKVRRQMQNLHNAATTIQAAFRSFICQKRYNVLTTATITIQRHYRAFSRGRLQRTKYINVRKSAIVLQSAFRSALVRKSILRMHQSAVVVQRNYRALLTGRKVRKQYLELHKATCSLQAAWRGRTVRKDLERQHNSAALIQSYYRMHVCQIKYRAMRQASLLIQRFYRAHKLGQSQRYLYLSLKKSAMVLQSAYRGWKVRRQMQNLHNAATTIQAAFRSFICQKRYNLLTTVTITIQRHYRAFSCGRLQRAKYINVRKSAIVLQSAFRSALVQKRIWRMHQSAVVVQRNYRALLTGRKVRKQYLELHKATCTLQAAWRGRKVRKTIKEIDKAATVIQSQYRMIRQRHCYRELREAAKVVQLRYRASKERDRHAHKYIAMRNAALCIQSAFRGMKVRRDLKAKHMAGAIIQRQYKCFLERRRFVQLRNAVILTQQSFRMKVHAEQIRQEYLKLKTAVVVLQAAFRGWKVREKMNRMHYSATIIQAAFRMHKAKDSYRTLKHAAIVLQQKYKANTIGKSERKQYLKQRQAAITIQANFRGMKDRKKMTCTIVHKAASKIQATFRMHQCKSQYIKIKWAVHVVQQRFRANNLRDFAILQYHLIKKAVLCIQSCYRGFKVRKELEFQHRMATRIQSAYKMYRRRVLYKNMQLSASRIQTWYRSVATSRQARAEFLQLRKATILIQAACRGMLVRKNMKAMHTAATCIQSFYRMYRQRKYFTIYLQAVCTIQQRYRAKMARDHYFHSYQKTRKAATVIQAGFRGMKSRMLNQQKHQAAATMQRAFKSFMERKSYLELSQYRALVSGKAERQKFLAYHNAVVCIQAAYRGFKEREKLKLRHRAATQIQSLFRMHKLHISYLANKQAAVVIQRYYRRYRSAKLERMQYLKVCKAAIMVQALYRGKRGRKTLRDMHKAATVVQACYRMHRQKKYYLALQQAVRTTQIRFKANRAKADAVKQYATVRIAVKTIQPAFLARKAAEETEMDSAVMIQAEWKMHTFRREFVKMKEAAVVIQAAFRGYRTRKILKVMNVSACLIQQWYRTCCLTRLQRAHYLSIRSSAITIQSAFRGMLARKVAKKEQAARKVQSFLVMTPHRRRFLRLRAAAIVLQSNYRMQRIRHAYEIQRESALVLHCCSKAPFTMKSQKEADLENETRIDLETDGRQFSSMENAAIKIQAQWRGYIQRRMFLRYKSAALLLQQRYRAHCFQKALHLQILQVTAITLQEQKAATVIQAAYRAFKIRNNFVRLKQAALTIQKHFRALRTGRCERIRYMQTRNAVLNLQACARGWLVRKENRRRHLMRIAYTLHLHLCAIKIQRRFKAHLALKHAGKHIRKVIFIQRWYRAKLQSRNRKADLLYHQKVVTLQHAIRAWLQRRNNAACRIQRGVREFLQRRHQARVVSGIVKFQALWRGYSCRKAQDTKAVQVLRNRLQRVSQDVKEENKLCNRTVVALDYLLSFKQLSFIIAALQHLEVATRLSAVCCENMAQSGAVKTIFVLIRSCNRSIPCMEAIKLSVMVLLNLSKYERTVQAVYEVENSVDILLDLMQIFREKAGDKVSDKGGSIFTKTCCLMAIFALNSQRAKEIRTIPKAMERIRSIYKLTCRKHKMDAERSICRQRMSTDSNMSIQATPVRTRVVSRIKPDWVLRKDNMREIVDPLKAIRMVMETLGVPS
ncbi:abnormal spindle-like microcephaly-associated protein homolog isoform X2 [Xenopus laevis]|uniref:Abnormal spindle-like microcephaly-associated protein homolog isoform X2 n=1 Tax=Xenopus laevis TaxID=8355 RepID=A0A8J0V2N2_XENLA|nr:abnormal spindle-like microcephaly-associated protein homolog isoform X2 [Xenopus laevis]